MTCVTPVDIFGSDGSTVLLPRGSQLTGETRGEARQGLARVFVLWTEVRTPPPDGVVALLDSPGTDELGRSGLPGQVNRHFFERFGAAILTSVVEVAIENATRPRNGDAVILNPSDTESVATEVLKSTVNIPPTILITTESASRYWSRATLIFGVSMNFAQPPHTDRNSSANGSTGASTQVQAFESSALDLTLRGLRSTPDRRRHGAMHQLASRGIRGDGERLAPRKTLVCRLCLVSTASEVNRARDPTAY